MNREDAMRFVDAYVDDELNVKDTLDVEAWIRRDAECRAEHDRVVTQKRIFREAMRDSVPRASEMLKKRAHRAMGAEWRKHHSTRRIVLVVAAVFVLVIGGWTTYSRIATMPAGLVAATMTIYKVEIQNPLDLKSSDINKVASWLHEKFQQEVRPVEFQQGRLIGVRLCPFAGQKGAFVRYRVGGRNTALLIGDSKGITYPMPMLASFRVQGQNVYEAEKDGYRLAFWKKGAWFFAFIVEDFAGEKNLMSDIFKSNTISF